MNKAILTDIFQECLDVNEACHGFEIQGNSVELHIVVDGYKYYEKYIPLEDFHLKLTKHFNDFELTT